MTKRKSTLDVDNSGQVIGKAIRLEETLPDGRLERGKAEHVVGVEFQERLHDAVTEVAHAVVEDDGMDVALHEGRERRRDGGDVPLDL